jgi:hypothetical protein
MTSPDELIGVDFAESGDVLLATCTGVYNAETDEYVDRAVAAECRTRGKLNVIVDYTRLRVARHHTVAESYAAASEIPDSNGHASRLPDRQTEDG